MNYGSNTIDTDAAIGTILSNFSTDYIYSRIRESIQMKFRPFDTAMPNLVNALERQLQLVLEKSPDYRDKVLKVREETYAEVIDAICQSYNLSFTPDQGTMDGNQLYGIASILYDTFVSNFTINLVGFFTRYIINNKEMIYNMIQASGEEKKDPGSYEKKYGTDPELLMIYANLNSVVYNMAGFDVDLQTLLSYFLDPNIAASIGSVLQDNGDIYKMHFACYVMDQSTVAPVITSIKLSIQEQAILTQNIQ